MAAWVLAAWLVPCLLGVALQRLMGFEFRSDRAGFLGRVFPFGFLTIAITLFTLMAVGVPINNLVVVYAALLVAIGLLFLKRKTADAEERLKKSRWAWAGIPILMVGAIGIIDNGAQHIQTPVYSDDDASIWTFKAKILHNAGRFNSELGESLRTQPSFHHSDYPLLNPLTQTWLLSASGGEAEGALRMPTMLWSLSLLLLLYSACARRTSRIIAALLSLMVVSAPILQNATTGTKSDVIVIVGLLGLLDFGLRTRRDVSFRHILAMALFASILAWSKNEGLMLLLTAGVALATIGTFRLEWVRRRKTWVLALPLLVIVGQMTFNSHFDLQNDLLTGGAGKDNRPLHQILIENTPEKAPTIASTFCEIATGLRLGQERVRPKPLNRVDVLMRTNGLFLVSLLLLLFFPRRALQDDLRALTVCALLSIAGFFVVYIISFEELLWHLYTSAPRVLFHLSGCLALAMALLFEQAHGAGFAVTTRSESPS